MNDHTCKLPDSSLWPMPGFTCPVCGTRWRLAVRKFHGNEEWVAAGGPVEVPVAVATPRTEISNEQEKAASMVEHRGLPAQREGRREQDRLLEEMSRDVRAVTETMPLDGLLWEECRKVAEYLIEKGWRK